MRTPHFKSSRICISDLARSQPHSVLFASIITCRSQRSGVPCFPPVTKEWNLGPGAPDIPAIVSAAA